MISTFIFFVRGSSNLERNYDKIFSVIEKDIHIFILLNTSTKSEPCLDASQYVFEMLMWDDPQLAQTLIQTCETMFPDHDTQDSVLCCFKYWIWKLNIKLNCKIKYYVENKRKWNKTLSRYPCVNHVINNKLTSGSINSISFFFEPYFLVFAPGFIWVSILYQTLSSFFNFHSTEAMILLLHSKT